MPRLRRFSSLVALIATALLAGCGIKPPPDPDATSPDRLPIVVPFDFSKAGNSVEVDFRVVAPRVERSSTRVDFGYFIRAPKSSDRDAFDAIDAYVHNLKHPMRIELWKQTKGILTPVPLFTSRYVPKHVQFVEAALPANNPVSWKANAYTPEQNGMRVKEYYSDGWYGAGYSIAHTHELAPGHYKVRIETSAPNDELLDKVTLLISHPFIGK